VAAPDDQQVETGCNHTALVFKEENVMCRQWILCGIILIMWSFGTSQGGTHYVPDDFPTIQGALDSVSGGDTIIVRPGIYYENIIFPGYQVILKSEMGPEETDIHGGMSGSVVVFQSGEDTQTVLEGFTIRNGSGTLVGSDYLGGGIYCVGSSPTIRHNFIVVNSVGTSEDLNGYGGGIYLKNAHPDIVDNIIGYNWSASDGAGISLGLGGACNPRIVNNLFVSNDTDNYGGASGGGIDSRYGDPEIRNCTFIGNEAAPEANGWGGGIRVNYSSYPVITNCIFWGNDAYYGPEISDYSEVLMIHYCDVKYGTGQPWFDPATCIALNPLFVSKSGAAYGYYYLSHAATGHSVDSPCIDTGDPNADVVWGATRIDDVPDSGFVDMGYHYYLPPPHVPRTWYVPDDYLTLQETIDAAFIGDTVVARPGTYRETIDLLGKAITVRSEWGPDVTVIDGEQAGSVVSFVNGEDRDTVLQGFTITNGLGTSSWGGLAGGGIFCDSSSPTITGNVVTGNVLADTGAGIFCWYSEPLITSTMICGNFATSWGGGLLILDWVGVPTLTNCTVADNEAGAGGGLACMNLACMGEVTVTNSIVWGNTALSDPQILDGGGVDVTYCDVEDGWPGTGNFDANPLFYDSTQGDYHLQWTSPCKDAGNGAAPELPDEDFEDDPRVALTGVDVGADEFYYHLYHHGPVQPGGPIDIRIAGGPAMPVKLYLGNGLVSEPFPTTYGGFYVPRPPLWQGQIGKVPASGILNFSTLVPTGWVPREVKGLQTLVGPYGGQYTRLTNPMPLVVE